jgi:Icc-related predicted phosphoesterase
MAWISGSKDITNAALQNEIPICVGGHVHWGRGVIHSSPCTFINASSLWPGNFGSLGVSKPVIVDFDVESRTVDRIECIPHQMENNFFFD